MSASAVRTRRSRASPGERGSSPVELVLLAPVLMLLIFLVVQAALYFYARQVLLAAAQQADRAARSAASPTLAASESTAAGLGYVRSLGPDLVSAPSFTLTHTATTATVVVTGRAVSILPGLALPIRAVSSGPLERFRPDLAGSAGAAGASGGAAAAGGGS
ncbi:MAG: TadE family protein [Mycobacteriales bacterium]